jgi:hypothetical protein
MNSFYYFYNEPQIYSRSSFNTVFIPNWNITLMRQFLQFRMYTSVLHVFTLPDGGRVWSNTNYPQECSSGVGGDTGGMAAHR